MKLNTSVVHVTKENSCVVLNLTLLTVLHPYSSSCVISMFSQRDIYLLVVMHVRMRQAMSVPHFWSSASLHPWFPYFLVLLCTMIICQVMNSDLPPSLWMARSKSSWEEEETLLMSLLSPKPI